MVDVLLTLVESLAMAVTIGISSSLAGVNISIVARGGGALASVPVEHLVSRVPEAVRPVVRVSITLLLVLVWMLARLRSPSKLSRRSARV